MNILLIGPPKMCPKNIWEGNPEVYPPLGLGYIASVLLKKGHDVKILDALLEDWNNVKSLDDELILVGMDFEAIAKFVKKLKVDIVGITGLSFNAEAIYKTAKEIKKINPNVIIVIGGPHATVRSNEVINQDGIDFVVIGEGEETVIGLVDVLERGGTLKELKKVEGIFFKRGGAIYRNKFREKILNLDSVPFPARKLFDMKKYFKMSSMGFSASGMRRWAAVITSRGCPFGCVFCSASLINGKRWRYRSPENVIEELKLLKRRYNIKEIFFDDENMSLNKKRMEEILDLIIEANLGLELYAEQGLRADTLDKKILIKMKKAGFKRITLAPESGSQRVLDEVIHKSQDLKKVEEVIISAKDVGIETSGFFVIGIPGETKEEIMQTIRYARKLRKLGAFYFTFNNALPIPGTELYKKAKERGELVITDEKAIEKSIVRNRHKHLLKTNEWTPEEVEELYKFAIKENSKMALFSTYLLKYRLRRLFFGMVHAPKVTIKRINTRLREFFGKRES